MGFPNDKQLNKMRNKLGKSDGFLMPDPDGSELDKFRFKICQELLKSAHKNDYKDIDMATFLEVTKADMSRIFNNRIDKFSTDKLLSLYSKIKPNYKLKVS